MAAIDDNIKGLEFTATTTKSRDHIRRLLDDAAEVAQGQKILLTDTTDKIITGVVRNFVRVQHATFTFTLHPSDDGSTEVGFHIPDYMRTRDTMFFIPVSPWSAPAFKVLREFSGYVRKGL